MNRFCLAGIGALVLIGMLTGCSSSGPVVPSETHAPGSPADVKIYSKAPKKYEVLQTLTLVASPEYKMDERGDATRGFAKLREKAAALGANGLLLDIDPNLSDILVEAAENGVY